MDQPRAAGAHPQRHELLWPNYPGRGARVEGEVDAEALAEFTDQGLDVTADAGRVALAQRARVHGNAQAQAAGSRGLRRRYRSAPASRGPPALAGPGTVRNRRTIRW